MAGFFVSRVPCAQRGMALRALSSPELRQWCRALQRREQRQYIAGQFTNDAEVQAFVGWINDETAADSGLAC